MSSWLAVVCLAFAGRAAIPATDQLLPADTLVVLTAPDMEKAASYLAASAQGRLWADATMSGFRESFVRRFAGEVLGPFGKELGLKFADYKDIARGQFTFALTQNGWDGKSDKSPGWLVLIDAKEKSEQLKTNLFELKKKWTDAGRPIRSGKISGVELTTLAVDKRELNKALEKAFPGSPFGPEGGDASAEKATEKEGARREIHFGQAESLLLVGSSTADIEKVLARLGGASGTPSLADQAGFQADRATHFRDALVFAWMNLQPIYGAFLERRKETAKPPLREPLLVPGMDKLLPAIGLAGVKSVALKLAGRQDGSLVEVFLTVPEDQHTGLFKAFALERKDASPPAFVPADVVKFSRWRFNGQMAWITLEKMLTNVSPAIAGLLQLGFETVGKEKDPGFDLKKNLVGNLGDDFIFFRKKPQSNSPADANSSPSITLIASPHTDQLVHALKAARGLLPLASMESTVHEREFLGRRVYSVPLPDPAPPNGTAKQHKRSFTFAAAGGYVALSTDAAVVEEYLRNAEGTEKGLRETPGLAETAQRVGGMSAGHFGFQNQREAMRPKFERLKRESEALDKIISAGSPATKAGSEAVQTVKGWFDFSLLPDFGKVSRYFHFAVYSLTSTNQGLSWKLFMPTPPELMKEAAPKPPSPEKTETKLNEPPASKTTELQQVPAPQAR